MKMQKTYSGSFKNRNDYLTPTVKRRLDPHCKNCGKPLPIFSFTRGKSPFCSDLCTKEFRLTKTTSGGLDKGIQ